MNELNNRAQARAIEPGGTFESKGHLYALPRAADSGLGTVFSALGRLVTRWFGSLSAPNRSYAMVNFLRSLRGRVDWPGNAATRRKMAAKYIVRALCMPRQHGRHLAMVYGNPRMCAYQRRDPRMLERHFHRYMHLEWNQRLRLQSIQEHYRFALARFPRVLFEAIYIYGNATLGTLTLKDGTHLKLCLRPPAFMGCEGELCIQLSDADDHPVYRLILSVIDDRPTLAIGCIQGPDGQNGKERVRDLTRNMHGMRPKQLMLSLAYAFARHCGIERILAVSNATHPLRRARDKFQADYDAFWQEQKGEATGDGWFLLPETPSRKSESTVSSHHRSAFRRRETMRIEAERLLLDAFETGRPKRCATCVEELLESVGNVRHGSPRMSWIG